MCCVGVENLCSPFIFFLYKMRSARLGSSVLYLEKKAYMTYTSSWELYRARSLYIDDGQAISKYIKKKRKKKLVGVKKKRFQSDPEDREGATPWCCATPHFLIRGGREVFIFFFTGSKKKIKKWIARGGSLLFCIYTQAVGRDFLINEYIVRLE